jgi:hypothetical protein
MLENHEAYELGLTDEPMWCKTYEIAFHVFPIPDRGTPSILATLASAASRSNTQLCNPLDTFHLVWHASRKIFVKVQ